MGSKETCVGKLPCGGKAHGTCHLADHIRFQAERGADPDVGWQRDRWQRFLNRVKSKSQFCELPNQFNQALSSVEPTFVDTV